MWANVMYVNRLNVLTSGWPSFQYNACLKIGGQQLDFAAVFGCLSLSIVSITKFSVVIGFPRAHLTGNRARNYLGVQLQEYQ